MLRYPHVKVSSCQTCFLLLFAGSSPGRQIHLAGIQSQSLRSLIRSNPRCNLLLTLKTTRFFLPGATSAIKAENSGRLSDQAFDRVGQFDEELNLTKLETTRQLFPSPSPHVLAFFTAFDFTRRLDCHASWVEHWTGNSGITCSECSAISF